MASIDNRVVKMDFQNAQFQSGVADTVSSLKQLGQTIDDTSTNSKLDNITAGIESVGSKFTWLNAIGLSVVNSLTSSIVGFGQSVVTNMLDPLVEGGKRRSLNIEQAKFQFEGLGMDVEASMASALAAVKGTSYGLDEAARIAAIFGTSGMKAGDQMTKALRGVAGVAAMSGASFADIGDIFTDIAGKGKVQAEDFNRLAARGVGAAAMLAKTMGITEGEVRDLASKGKIDFETFSQAMYDAFGEHATKANETYAGSLSNVKAALSRIGEAFYTPYFERQREIFNALTPAIDAVAKALEPVIKLYTDWQGIRADKSVDLITNSLVPFIEQVAPAVENVANTFRNLGRLATSIVSPIGNAFKAVFGGTNFVNGLADAIVNLTKWVEQLTSKWELSSKAQETVFKVSEKIFSTFKSGAKVIANIAKSIEEFLKGLLGASTGLNDSFDSSFDILDKLQEAVATLAKASSSLPELARSAGSSVKDFLSNVGSKLWEFLKNVGGWISDNVTFKNILTSIFGTGSILFFTKIYKLVSNLTDVIEKIKDFFDKDKVQKTSTLIDGVKDTLSQFGDVLGAFTTNIKVGSLVLIASAVAILTLSISTLSKIDSRGLTKATIAMGALFSMLTVSLGSFTKSVNGASAKNLLAAGATLLLVSFAIRNITKAVKGLSELNMKELGKGLGSIGAILTALSLFLSKTSFTKIPVSTTVAILALSVSLNIIASAVKKLGDMPLGDLAKGLGSMATVMVILSKTLTSMGKISTSSLGNSVAILIASAALVLIGKALTEVSKLSWGEIAKGLSGIGGALGLLALAFKALKGVSSVSSIGSAAAILIGAQALNDIGNALSDIGKLDWDEIGRGLTGIGGALLELSGVLTLIGKNSPLGSFVASASILIAVQSLSDIGDALADISRISWGGIAKGLTGIGVALSELLIVFHIMQKFSSGKTIIAAGTILLAVQSLSDIGDALADISRISWGGIAKGLTGIGVALSELLIVFHIMQKFSSGKTIIAAGTILLAVKALEPIGDVLQELSTLSWSDIARSLTALAGAMIIIGGVVTLMGTLGSGFSLLGAASLLIAVKALPPIGEVLQTLSSLSWGDIARSLTALAGALAVIAAGSFLNTLSAIGGASIGPAAKNLGVLADGLKQFGEMSWEEIGRGLTAMGSAMGIIATGSLANTFGIIGSLSIKEVAEPLGILADSIKKWTTIEVPASLSKDLAAIALGIQSFNFAFVGAKAIEAGAEPLGTLADSVRKWATVIVPKGMKSDLEELAKGVQAWTFAFVGGWSIGASTEGIGDLASAIQKWNGVTVPENMQSKLTGLAKGVQAWTWAFMGGWSMGVSVDPIGDLASAVKKWNGVTVPENMQSKLTGLAKGVQAWTWAFMGGWSMGVSVDPIGDLASAVKKWNGVSIPENLNESLKSLSDGVKSWTWAFAGGLSMDASVEPLAKLAGAVGLWSDINVPSNMDENLGDLARGIKEFGWLSKGTGSMADSIQPIKDLASAVKRWEGVSISGLGETFKDIATGVKSFDGIGDSIDNLSAAANPVGRMGTALLSWSGVTSPAGLGIGLVIFATGLAAVASVSGLSGVPATLVAISASMVLLGLGLQSSTRSMQSLTSGISAFAVAFRILAASIQGTSNLVVIAISNMRARMATEFRLMTAIAALLVIQFTLTMNRLPQAASQAMQKVGSAISASASTVSAHGRSMVATLYRNISIALYAQSGSVTAPARTVGAAISSGIARGISSTSYLIKIAAIVAANAALRSAKEALGIKSPSKRFASEVGRFIPMGLAKGMTDNLSYLVTAGQTLADTTVDATYEAMLQAQAILENRDISPTITPIVDLSDVTAKSAELAKITGEYDSVLASSYSNAAAANSKIARSGTSSSAGASSPVINNVTYNQTNTSPKALSTAEIYRKTKNQLSTIKKGLNLPV